MRTKFAKKYGLEGWGGALQKNLCWRGVGNISKRGSWQGRVGEKIEEGVMTLKETM